MAFHISQVTLIIKFRWFYAGETILGTPERGHQGAVPPKKPILAVFGDFLMKGAKWYQTERAIEFVRPFYIGKGISEFILGL